MEPRTPPATLRTRTPRRPLRRLTGPVASPRVDGERDQGGIDPKASNKSKVANNRMSYLHCLTNNRLANMIRCEVDVDVTVELRPLLHRCLELDPFHRSESESGHE